MKEFFNFLAGGLLQFSWWQIILVTLVLTHITIVSVTVFLHRGQAHRGLDLHPAVAHFFRFWLWLTTGMVTKEWVAIHRKHHARCEREGDPHSPVVFGLGMVFFRGAELYRQEARNEETLRRFGHGTPDDWVERNIYSRYTLLGIMIMLAIDLALFGLVGLAVWAVQMAWIPFWAAGVVNGVGHAIGYRNFASPDTSTNIIPIGIIIGGEELHNNHHAFASSAKFSNRWFELDIGWIYISILRFFKLAHVKKVAPKLRLEPKESTPSVEEISHDTLQGVITHRYEILARYAEMLRDAAKEELEHLRAQGGLAMYKLDHHKLKLIKRSKEWIGLKDEILEPEEREQLETMLENKDSKLSVMMQMHNELTRIWQSSTASSEQLLADLRAWCKRAQQSGIQSLEEFAQRLLRYAA
ncbi:MAG TPA: fatty acid desaturase [Paenalcaligenes sp.]|nr:fatty acid desaturase [Paenalcaligenes sp.]